MNIPDEYFTDEVPTGTEGIYLVKTKDGRRDLHVMPRGSSLGSLRGARFCRLAPAAEVERLKVENEKLRGLVYDAYAEAEQDARTGSGGWVMSVTKSEMDRLEGGVE